MNNDLVNGLIKGKEENYKCNKCEHTAKIIPEEQVHYTCPICFVEFLKKNNVGELKIFKEEKNDSKI